MRKHSGGPRFAKQPLAQFFALLRVVNVANSYGFDGDGTADRRIGRVINHAHGAAAQFADDPVAADVLHIVMLSCDGRRVRLRPDRACDASTLLRKSIATSSTQKRAPRRDRNPRCPPCSVAIRRRYGLDANAGCANDFKRNESVVLRLDQQRRHADPVQIILRRLRRVIMIGSFETERRRGDPVVDFVKRSRRLEFRRRIAPGREQPLRACG